MKVSKINTYVLTYPNLPFLMYLPKKIFHSHIVDLIFHRLQSFCSYINV
ncbi:unnamed protein product [Brassica oleracea var. botrytis]